MVREWGARGVISDPEGARDGGTKSRGAFLVTLGIGRTWRGRILDERASTSLGRHIKVSADGISLLVSWCGFLHFVYDQLQFVNGEAGSLRRFQVILQRVF